MIYKGFITSSGELEIIDYPIYKKMLKAHPNTNVWVEILAKKPVRDSALNNLYWKILGIIESKSGHTKQELHEMFKEKFLSYREEIFNDPQMASTRFLTNKEMKEYIEKIRQEIFESGEFLPSLSDTEKAILYDSK